MTHPMLKKVVEATSEWTLEKDGAGYRVRHGCVVYGRLHGIRSAALKELETRRARAAVQALLEPDEGMVPEGIAAALTAMAYAGLPGDWSEALLRGDGRGTVPPGVLRKGVEAYRRAMLLPLVEGEGRQPTPGVYGDGQGSPGKPAQRDLAD